MDKSWGKNLSGGRCSKVRTPLGQESGVVRARVMLLGLCLPRLVGQGKSWDFIECNRKSVEHQSSDRHDDLLFYKALAAVWSVV